MSQLTRRGRRSALLLFAVVLVSWLATSRVATAVELRPYHTLSAPCVLALTPGLADEGMAQLLDRLAADGLQASVAVAGAGIVVVDEPGTSAALTREKAITAVLRGPSFTYLRGAPAGTRGLMRWWNDGFATPKVAREEQGLRIDVPICDGSHTLEEALAERGMSNLRCAPAGTGRTHFVEGRSVANVVFPESVGGDADWLADDLDESFASVVRACNW